MQAENFESNKKIIGTVEEIAKASQVALAWILAKGKDIIPITGTKREKYLTENIDAVKIKSSIDEIGELDKLYSLVKDNRYDDSSMATTLQ